MYVVYNDGWRMVCIILVGIGTNLNVKIFLYSLDTHASSLQCQVNVGVSTGQMFTWEACILLLL